jgi:hypothetical protein
LLGVTIHPGHEDTDVKRSNNPQLPMHDYRQALKSAVSWLGERYVLAEPVRKHRAEAKPFFAETPSWLPSTTGASRKLAS